MTSSSDKNCGNDSENIFILGYDGNDFGKSFVVNCEDSQDVDDSEICVVPIEDPLRIEPICIELISDIEDDDVCIINDDASITFFSREKLSKKPSSARNSKDNTSKDVVYSEKKFNRNKKISNGYLKLNDDTSKTFVSREKVFEKQSSARNFKDNTSNDVVNSEKKFNRNNKISNGYLKLNDDTSKTFVSREKVSEKQSSARTFNGNISNDVVHSEKKLNRIHKITNYDLEKIDKSNHSKKSDLDYSYKPKRPKKESPKVSGIKNKKECSLSKAKSQVSDSSEEEEFHKTSELIFNKNLKTKRSSSSTASRKPKKTEKKEQLSSVTSFDQSLNSDISMMLDHCSFKPSDIVSVPEPQTTDNTNNDTNIEGISFMTDDILLLAWELEIKKQEELRESSGRSRQKPKSCDCRLVHKTLSEDHSYETKRRVNYLTKYTCCEFRKTVLGHVYYVPIITPETESSSKNKRPVKKSKGKLKRKLGVSVEKDFEDNSKGSDDLSADDTCFDNLIESEIKYLMDSQPDNDNGYCSNSEVSKGEHFGEHFLLATE